MSVQGKRRIQVQIDKNLADEANLIFNELGLNQTVVITAFYKRVVADGGLPFELKLKDKKKVALKFSKATVNLPAKILSTKEEVDAWSKDIEQDY
ncbi:type II toxin-antitoxin system RelB/DinJ family antitoxin [Alkalibacterium sp. f15]|uniref:type II toxin-antitoxin system RelB/DinJ family antitoxin n=1 Tax=Alkalibacterium sp. f15 TaxID=3414029 RepID=UPI003BF84977